MLWFILVALATVFCFVRAGWTKNGDHVFDGFLWLLAGGITSILLNFFLGLAFSNSVMTRSCNLVPIVNTDTFAVQTKDELAFRCDSNPNILGQRVFKSESTLLQDERTPRMEKWEPITTNKWLAVWGDDSGLNYKVFVPRNSVQFTS